jgi:polysaccharide export outer membrane protein
LAQEQEKEDQLQKSLGWHENERTKKSRKEVIPTLPGEDNLIAEQFRSQREDHAKEASHLQEVSKRLAERASLLREQKMREDEGSRADAEEYDRAKTLLERGTSSVQRVIDARRATLLSATRALQTGAEAAQVALAQQEIARNLQKLHDQHRTKLMSDLQDTRMKIVRIEAQLAANSEKLTIIGSMRSSWISGNGGRPNIVIQRDINRKAETIDASESTPLLPGDVVEVTLRAR